MAEKDQDKTTEKDGQEVRPTEQQTVFPKSASEDPGLPPNVADPSAGLHEERGLTPPYAGDGSNVGMVHPRIDDPPGVTGIDRGSDPSVASFIPDVTGPRVAGEEEAAATAEERSEESADPNQRVAGDKARAARGDQAVEQATGQTTGTTTGTTGTASAQAAADRERAAQAQQAADKARADKGKK
jgi:hypothetical protein